MRRYTNRPPLPFIDDNITSVMKLTISHPQDSRKLNQLHRTAVNIVRSCKTDMLHNWVRKILNSSKICQSCALCYIYFWFTVSEIITRLHF